MKELIDFANSIYPISTEAAAALEKICTLTNVPKYAEVQPIGQSCKTIYFIQKGALRIYYLKDGVDITESFQFENTIVARIESLFSGKPSSKAIQALEAATLVLIPTDKLTLLYSEFQSIERLFRKIFEESHMQSIHRLESIQFHSADERYQNLLRENPQILQRIPLKYIASYLGITPVSLSRIRANL
jgi:CRP-like cAMP-binding protein